MSDLRATATTLFTTYTGAPRSSIVEVVEGQNAVVVIGRDEVLRLPRTADAAGRLDLTARLGRALGSRLPIPIPQPHVHSITTSEAGSFSIERRLPGEPLSPAVVSELSTATQRSLARQLFAFLQALHGIDLDGLRAEAPLPVVNPREEWNEIVRRARTELAAWWSPALERRFLDEAVQFETTFDDGVVATLRHGDFGGANILFDRERQRVTAILDFGGSRRRGVVRCRGPVGIAAPPNGILPGGLSPSGSTLRRRCRRPRRRPTGVGSLRRDGASAHRRASRMKPTARNDEGVAARPRPSSSGAVRRDLRVQGLPGRGAATRDSDPPGPSRGAFGS